MTAEKESKNVKKIVIVGAGFGGVFALKELHNIFHKSGRVQITVINDNNYFLFTPLLHEVATGSIAPENIIEPLRKIMGCCIDNLISGKVEKIDTESSVVYVDKEKIHYDYLILAPGAQTNFYNVKGAEENTLTLKSLEDAIKIKNMCIDTLEEGSKIKDEKQRKNKLRFVVVGGGPTGVELVSELQEFLKYTFSNYYTKDLIDDISVFLVHSGEEILQQFPKELRWKSIKILKKKGIKVLLNTKVVEVLKDRIQFENGEFLISQNVVWVAGIKPSFIHFDKSITRDESGRLLVNEYLELLNHSNIFCLGDVASFKQENKNLPSLAQVAVKQARTLAININKKMDGKRPKVFIYKSAGLLLSLGKWNALGKIYNFVIEGRFAWWLWRTVYLTKMISWHKKLKVVVDWTLNAFSPRDISKL